MSGEAILLPEWTPGEVRHEIKLIASSTLPDMQADILIRLVTDDRMRSVWKELVKRDRKSGQYVHPAKMPEGSFPWAPDKVQERALAETFHFVWRAASDRVRVRKPAEIEHIKAALVADAATARRFAHEGGPLLALEQVARAKEHDAALGRCAGDPLLVTNDRGDPVLRGLQIVIAAFLLGRFGNRFDGIVAILAAVALGLTKEKVSQRASQSAFSRKKTV